MNERTSVDLLKQNGNPGSNMLRVVTVADCRFLQQARHLKRSLLLSNPNAHLTIYCDCNDVFADLLSQRCAVIEIPDMAALGVKRSKLAAFRHAIESGSFLYLDADAIVLEPLDELACDDALSGCADNLSHCPFILDKHHPWPNAPDLLNTVYINSGIFFAPAARQPFFEELHKQSRIDSVWDRYIFPEKLFDNHFFCAFLNLSREPIRFLDQHVYGWQGFWYDGGLQVERRANQLINKGNGKVLKIVLFAGLKQSYDLLFSLPADIASLLLQRIMPGIEQPDEALAQYLAATSPQLAGVQDPYPLLILQRIVAEVRHLVEHAEKGTWRNSRSYFSDPEAMRAFACAQPSSECEWNGIKCGGAYLEGEEYASIRDIVKALDIRTVLETGAGESSIFFSKLGIRAISVESQPGHWLDRARAHDCTVLEVPFDDVRAEFEEESLRSQLQAVGLKKVDLLFIDSPVGTARRRKLLSQFMGILPMRYVLYHDAIRDAPNIFRDQQVFGLRLVAFMNSVRGLALLGNQSGTFEYRQQIANARIDPSGVRIATQGPELRTVTASTEVAYRILIDNCGTSTISSRIDYPVLASYHWVDSKGETVVFDGIRTPLPFDVHPGDSCTCFVNVVTPDRPGHYELQLTLVQELICWFHDHNPNCLISILVEVGIPADEPGTFHANGPDLR